MSRRTPVESIVHFFHFHSAPRKRLARWGRKRSLTRCWPRVEQMEERITPSVLTVFELDANVTTGIIGPPGSTTLSHDWDQIFSDVQNGTTNGGAIATSFVTDAVNSRDDNIFAGGGSKDTVGIGK